MSERNGQRSSEEIENDIHQSRERLDSTLHELEERFSPQQLMNSSYDYLRHGGANEFVSNLGNTIKQNPLPFLMTSAGLGWLMFAQRNSSAQKQSDRAIQPTPPGSSAQYGGGVSQSSPGIAVHEGTRAGERSNQPGTVGANSTPYGSEPSAVDATVSGHAMGDTHSTSNHGTYNQSTGYQSTGSQSTGYQRTGSSQSSGKGRMSGVKDKAQHMSGKVKETAQHMGGKARHMGEHMGEKAQHMGGNMRDKTSHLQSGSHFNMHGMSHRARNIGSQSTGFIQEHPLVTAALGFALGAALGGIFPSTRKEDEYLGEYRDRAMQRAAQTGQEQLDRTQQAVHEKAEAAKEASQHKDTSHGVSTSRHEQSAASGKNPLDNDVSNNASGKSSSGTNTPGAGSSGKSTPTGSGYRSTGLSGSDTPSGNTQGAGTNRTSGQ